jgi:hypothetical protein
MSMQDKSSETSNRAILDGFKLTTDQEVTNRTLNYSFITPIASMKSKPPPEFLFDKLDRYAADLKHSHLSMKVHLMKSYGLN